MIDVRMAPYKNLFLETSGGYLRNIKKHMKLLLQNPSNKISQNEMFRLVHTLKSQNFAMGLPVSANLCKHMESVLRSIREGRNIYSQSLNSLFRQAVSHLEISLDHIEKGGDEVDSAITSQNLMKFVEKN